MEKAPAKAGSTKKIDFEADYRAMTPEELKRDAEMALKLEDEYHEQEDIDSKEKEEDPDSGTSASEE
jgi:hypothetical protein